MKPEEDGAPSRPPALAGSEQRRKSSSARAMLRRYSGAKALEYEQRRRGHRWDAEATAFRELYQQVRPGRVLDCPVGTGRWLDTYLRDGAEVVGLDISLDMLAIARRKSESGRLTLHQADVLAAEGLAYLGSDYDLIVCTRFLHWLDPRAAERLLLRYGETKSRFLIVGAHTGQLQRPGKLLRESRYRKLRRLVRAPFTSRARRYVHDRNIL